MPKDFKGGSGFGCGKPVGFRKKYASDQRNMVFVWFMKWFMSI